MNLNSEVTILGATGMLGSACAKEFPNAKTPTRREIDAETDTPRLTGWVINCIGSIPQREKNDEMMWKINAEFPKRIEAARVIQIVTDCVFDGQSGSYSENSVKSATDQYGRSKIIGEEAKSMKIRCSIIGPDKTNASLFEWVCRQPEGAEINGYVDHIWNGVTTQIFAKLCSGLIQADFYFNDTFHFVPADKVSKFELLSMIAAKTGRTDLSIKPVETLKPIDRSLITNNPEINEKFWALAGFDKPPTVQEMINVLNLQ
jgi:dTDP-4-dehydrorhamnose reductase